MWFFSTKLSKIVESFFHSKGGKVRVDMPITKHKLVMKHLSIYSSFIFFSNDFHGYGCTKWRSTISLWISKNKSNEGEAWKEWFVKITKCLKRIHWSLVHFDHISPSFFICLEWSKKFKICQLEFYKTFLNSRGKKTMSNDFKLQITNCFNMPITKHQPLFTLKSHIFFNSFFF